MKKCGVVLLLHAALKEQLIVTLPADIDDIPSPYNTELANFNVYIWMVIVRSLADNRNSVQLTMHAGVGLFCQAKYADPLTYKAVFSKPNWY